MQIHANHKGETTIKLTRTETGVLRRAAQLMLMVGVNTFTDSYSDAGEALNQVATNYGVKDEPAITAK